VVENCNFTYLRLFSDPVEDERIAASPRPLVSENLLSYSTQRWLLDGGFSCFNTCNTTVWVTGRTTRLSYSA